MSEKRNDLRFIGASKADDQAGNELPLNSVIPSKTNRQIDTDIQDLKDA